MTDTPKIPRCYKCRHPVATDASGLGWCVVCAAPQHVLAAPLAKGVSLTGDPEPVLQDEAE